MPKNFQGAERPNQFTPAERRAPGAERRAPSAHFSEATSIPPKSYALGENQYSFCEKGGTIILKVLVHFANFFNIICFLV